MAKWKVKIITKKGINNREVEATDFATAMNYVVKQTAADREVKEIYTISLKKQK